jgi:oligoendopeptidase F
MKSLRKIFSRRAKDSRDHGAHNDNHKDPLPKWNLRQIYHDINAPALKRDQKKIEKMIAVFKENYEDGVVYLAPDEFGVAIMNYERISALRNRIYCYATLLEADDRTQTERIGPLLEWLAKTEDDLAFFESEISNIKESALLLTMTDPIVSQYAPWIARVRAGAEYILDDATEEKIADIYQKQKPLFKLYHDTIAAITVPTPDGVLRLDVAHAALGGAEIIKHDALRQNIGTVLKLHAADIASIYNQIIDDNNTVASIRGYDRPDHETHLENGLEDETVDRMRENMLTSAQKLSHRFYAWKAAQFGVQQLTRGQAAASPPAFPDVPEFAFKQAKKTVLESFGHLSPRLQTLARKFFTTHHLDALPCPEKESNPFALPAGPDDYPYILVNYNGELSDVVSGLGHELGHGVHFALSEKTRGFFLSENTTILCETAAIFAEMLVYDELIRQEKDTLRRRMLEAQRTEGVLMNALQQITYYNFELRVHEERKKGVLDAEQISDIWLATQRDFFGPSVKLDDYDRYYWMTVPHFFNTPFYVYSYAFAQNVVNGLYQAYQTSQTKGEAGKQQFAEAYIELLRTGVTKDLYQTLRPFGLDAESVDFWEKSIETMQAMCDRVIDPSLKKPSGKPKRSPPRPGL